MNFVDGQTGLVAETATNTVHAIDIAELYPRQTGLVGILQKRHKEGFHRSCSKASKVAVRASLSTPTGEGRGVRTKQNL